MWPGPTADYCRCSNAAQARLALSALNGAAHECNGRWLLIGRPCSKRHFISVGYDSPHIAIFCDGHIHIHHVPPLYSRRTQSQDASSLTEARIKSPARCSFYSLRMQRGSTIVFYLSYAHDPSTTTWRTPVLVLHSRVKSMTATAPPSLRLINLVARAQPFLLACVCVRER